MSPHGVDETRPPAKIFFIFHFHPLLVDIALKYLPFSSPTSGDRRRRRFSSRVP
jgi:hypothetical protein